MKKGTSIMSDKFCKQYNGVNCFKHKPCGLEKCFSQIMRYVFSNIEKQKADNGNVLEFNDLSCIMYVFIRHGH